MSGRKFLPMPFTTLKLIELGLFGRCLKGVWKVSGGVVRVTLNNAWRVIMPNQLAIRH